MMAATSRMRSASATDDPPNFITTVTCAGAPGHARRLCCCKGANQEEAQEGARRSTWRPARPARAPQQWTLWNAARASSAAWAAPRRWGQAAAVVRRARAGSGGAAAQAALSRPATMWREWAGAVRAGVSSLQVGPYWSPRCCSKEVGQLLKLSHWAISVLVKTFEETGSNLVQC